MKTSQKIIVVYSILIIGGMFFLFTDAKVKAKSDKAVFTLSSFSVIVAEKDADLHIIQSDSNYITAEGQMKKLLSGNKLFEIVNDTLHVYKGARMFVKCKELTSIAGKNAFWLGIDKFNTDSLKVDLYGGQFYFTPANEMSKIDFFELTTRDSAYVEMQNVNIKKININADNKSNIQLHGIYNEISATLQHGSNLRADNNYKVLHVERVE